MVLKRDCCSIELILKICSAKDLAKKQCLEACFEIKDLCTEAAKVSLVACMTAANGTLDQELSACTQTVPAEKFACENAARVKAFSARLSCQSAFKLDTAAQTALRTCRANGNQCVTSCKVAKTPVPTPTPQ